MTYKELQEKRASLQEKLEAIQSELSDLDTEISKCPESVTGFFPNDEVLRPIIDTLAFVVEEEEEIYAKVPLDSYGFRFAFKDSPEVTYLSRNVSNHWVNQHELVTPSGKIDFNPSGFWEDFWENNPNGHSQDAAMQWCYERELEKDRVEAVASLLWYNVGW